MKTELAIKSSEGAFLALKKSATDLAEKCSNITIKDEPSKLMAIQSYSLLKEKISQIEEIREKEKKPYLDAGRQIDALAKALKEPMDKVLQDGRARVMVYEKEQRVIAEKEVERVKNIKDSISRYAMEGISMFSECATVEDLSKMRDFYVINFVPPTEWSEEDELFQSTKSSLNDYCKNRRIEILSPAQADETVAETIKEIIAEKIEEVVPVAYQSTTKIKGIWKHRIVDESKVPLTFLSVDDKKIKEFIRDKKDELVEGVVGGIEFYFDETVTIK